MAEMRTKRGYDFYEASSTMQKAIRRNDVKVAGFFALELYHSGYWNYVWKRLFTISAEDVWGLITAEIDALYKGFMIVNGNKPENGKGRIFISKAVILLCHAAKSRDADHLQNLIYDNLGLTDEDIAGYADYLEDNETKEAIPEYAFDVHTRKGRKAGKTKADFFRDEQAALKPLMKGLFDDLV